MLTPAPVVTLLEIIVCVPGLTGCEDHTENSSGRAPPAVTSQRVNQTEAAHPEGTIYPCTGFLPTHSVEVANILACLTTRLFLVMKRTQ